MSWAIVHSKVFNNQNKGLYIKYIGVGGGERWGGGEAFYRDDEIFQANIDGLWNSFENIWWATKNFLMYFPNFIVTSSKNLWGWVWVQNFQTIHQEDLKKKMKNF